MEQITTLGPDAEVLGGAIHGFINALNHKNIQPHLERLGMTDIDPQEWYPKQMYVDLWNAILQNSNSAMFDLVSVGMVIAKDAWPPEADHVPVEDLIMGWGDAFDAVNRGADRGYVRSEKLGDKHYTIACCTPDPDNLQYGVVYGFCQRFLPPGSNFTVYYDPDLTRRDYGGEETVIHITWE